MEEVEPMSFADFEAELNNVVGIRNAVARQVRRYINNQLSRIRRDDETQAVYEFFKEQEKHVSNRRRKDSRITTEFQLKESYAELHRNWSSSPASGDRTYAIATYFFFHVHTGEPSYARLIDEELFDGNTLEQHIAQKNTADDKDEVNLPCESYFGLPEYSNKSDADAWLNAHNHAVFELYHREDELLQLESFLGGGSGFKVWSMIGPSGAGKTRLAGEWLRKLSQQGEWVCGFVKERDKKPWKQWNPISNTVIVIDYTYYYDEVFGTIFERCKSIQNCKIRVLLLDHVFPELLRKDFALRTVIPGRAEEEQFRDNYLHATTPLDLSNSTKIPQILRDMIAHRAERTVDDPIVEKALEHLFGLAKREFGNEEGKKDQEIDFVKSAVLHPLFAALIGEAIRTSNSQAESDFTNWSRRDLIDHYLDREKRVPWQATGATAGEIGFWVGSLVGVATLRRGIRCRSSDLI